MSKKSIYELKERSMKNERGHMSTSNDFFLYFYLLFGRNANVEINVQ